MSRWLHVFAAVVSASTALLIFAGGMVTSTGSGLAVPDWPNTYGWFMFAFPLEKMVGGIFYEHGHRLIASVVGLLILILAVWLWRVEPRRWVRWLGFAALAAVVTQGILGGITVLWFLPTPISVAHASLAQIVFCLTVAITLFTSSGWRKGYATQLPATPDERGLQKIALVTLAAVYLQIVIGATMRHTGAGLAIPDFPLAFGQIIPPTWDPKIAVHFAHRVGAVVVSGLIAATVAHVSYHHRTRRELMRPSLLLLALLTVQITLGALTVLTARHEIINSLHVVTGGLVLVTTLVLTLRAFRARFADVSQPSRTRQPDRPAHSARTDAETWTRSGARA